MHSLQEFHLFWSSEIRLAQTSWIRQCMLRFCLLGFWFAWIGFPEWILIRMLPPAWVFDVFEFCFFRFFLHHVPVPAWILFCAAFAFHLVVCMALSHGVWFVWILPLAWILICKNFAFAWILIYMDFASCMDFDLHGFCFLHGFWCTLILLLVFCFYFTFSQEFWYVNFAFCVDFDMHGFRYPRGFRLVSFCFSRGCLDWKNLNLALDFCFVSTACSMKLDLNFQLLSRERLLAVLHMFLAFR